MPKCFKCQSENIIPDVRLTDRAGTPLVTVSLYDHPNALVFKGKHSVALRSQVCGECGYVESYIDNPQELYTLYKASLSTD